MPSAVPPNPSTPFTPAKRGGQLCGRAQRLRTAVRRLALILTCAVAGAPTLAHADSDTDTFQVTATVLAACEVTAQDLAFGNYDPIAASDLDATTTLSVTCTNGTPYDIEMSLGDGGGATSAVRYMSKGADTLAYTLYRDAGRTQLWSNGAEVLSGSGTGSAQLITVYGRVPMQQAAPSGAYEDSIIVSVTW